MDENKNSMDLTEQKAMLEIQEQQLKVRELQLKIKELRRPEYKRLNFWTSATAALIALIGVLGQSILSSIKNERAQLEMKEAQAKKDTAIRFIEKATLDLKVARDSQTIAQQAYAILKYQTDTASKYLAKLKADIQKIATEKNNSQINELTSLVNQTTRKLTELPPRVYIQIADENQRGIATRLKDKLQANDFVCPGIENIGGKANIPTKTEVRYYRDQEKEEALKLVALAKQIDIGVEMEGNPVKISSYYGRGIRPRHYEIWFSKN